MKEYPVRYYTILPINSKSKNISRNYPGKLLLFGEYTILKGGAGLAVPLERFYGSWKYFDGGKNIQPRRKPLQGLAKHLIDQGFGRAAESFLEEIRKGLYFDSNIPLGYGAGSSGALTAAVYDRFISPDNAVDDLVLLRDQLAGIEDFFHGSSSGLDPLISLLEKALLITPDGGIKPVKVPSGAGGMFLLDTGKPRKTDPLVAVFKEKWDNDPVFKEEIETKVIPIVNRCIEYFLSGSEAVQKEVEKLSQWQAEYLREMIPEELRELWYEGLKTGDYTLKLCGAGGGGYMIGWAGQADLIGAGSINGFRINWL